MQLEWEDYEYCKAIMVDNYSYRYGIAYYDYHARELKLITIYIGEAE